MAGGPSCRQGTRHGLGPYVDVTLRVGIHDRLSRGAGRGVDLHDLMKAHQHLAHRQEPVGVHIAHLILCGERQAGDVVDSLDVLRPDAHAVHLLLIEGDPSVQDIHEASQPFPLQAHHGGAGEGLEVSIPDHRCTFLLKRGCRDSIPF